MLAIRHGIARQSPSTGYVCLSCRTKQHQRRRIYHDSTQSGGSAAFSAPSSATTFNRASGKSKSGAKDSRRNGGRDVPLDVQQTRWFSASGRIQRPPQAGRIKKKQMKSRKTATEEEERRVAESARPLVRLVGANVATIRRIASDPHESPTAPDNASQPYIRRISASPPLIGKRTVGKYSADDRDAESEMRRRKHAPPSSLTKYEVSPLIRRVIGKDNPPQLVSKHEIPAVSKVRENVTKDLKRLTNAVERHLSNEEERSSAADVADRGSDENVKYRPPRDTLDHTSMSTSRFDLATELALAFLEGAADDSAAVNRGPGTDRSTHSSFPSIPARSGRFAWQKIDPTLHTTSPSTNSRRFHISAKSFQQAAAVQESHDASPPPVFDPQERTGIRKQLQKWQDLYGHEDPMPDIQPKHDLSGPVNNFTRLPDETNLNDHLEQEPEDDDDDILAQFGNIGSEGFDGDARDDPRLLQMGDLVELDFPGEREGLLAVFVRKLSDVAGAQALSLYFTMTGKWMHVKTKVVQFSIPGFVSPEVLEPLMQYLPEVEKLGDIKDLLARAYVEDLSVPREVAAPVVSKLLKFYNESNEIYRKNARALDDAHEILAHPSDLRYGSIASAAATLLKLPSNRLPLAALFTVRKALSNAGFAFNMDRRSHRVTGYMQIRSKEQVKMVEAVREWFRQWQDHVALVAGMEEKQKQSPRFRPPKGARHVYSFIEKAKAIVMKNREYRDCRPASGSVGISKVRLPLLPITRATGTASKPVSCVSVTKTEEFTAEETAIVRFLEAFACAGIFLDHPRMQALPPLLLHATGLYPQHNEFGMKLTFVFLQEIGTIMPYENRIRFDPHLLLPSSQHSKPLQNLMNSLIVMRGNPDFQDSMATLRHDWGNLPVYCIDRADAQEIDDGISIESAGTGSDGEEQHWIHVHIANPTAFFSRDHPLSKMARHMGETIYMPERNYMMLPKWSTTRHFSLAKDRPCLTFSAKLDSEGRTLERKITPGIVHNVLQLTADDIDEMLGVESTFKQKHPELVFSVGGVPPQEKPTQPLVVTAQNKRELETLQSLAAKLAGKRSAAGGFFFDMHHPEVAVWQNHTRPGLEWDHPWRKGRRTVEGDPVIQFRTHGLINWFQATTSVVDVTVREFMLLACEIAASWCAERKIPVIYRGSSTSISRDNAKKYYEEVLVPNMSPDGSVPLHLGRQWVPMAGLTVLRTTPKFHNHLGMSHYTKATSPLRRYGDMILHWQIEAALRHEASTGESLITPPDSTKSVDRSFLPFSAPVLETIMLGLAPREQIVVRAKRYANSFWTSMLLFRKFYYNEDGPLPFHSRFHPEFPPMRIFLINEPTEKRRSVGSLMELNVVADMSDPVMAGLPEPRIGDVWEVSLDSVEVYTRVTNVRPLRLVGREGAGVM